MRCKSALVVVSPSPLAHPASAFPRKPLRITGELQSPTFAFETMFLMSSFIVVAADGLSKREVFRLPDPFAVITVDAEQTHTSSVIRKTLNPYWNESFDM
jgi:hypothetical protein